MKIEMVNVSDLKPAEYNPRVMAREVMDKLKKGIKEFGLVEPIVINKDGTVIGGHQRLQASIELGHTEVPCVRKDLDRQRERALNLALNKLSGDWDFGKLSDILLEFEADISFDVELTGFDNIELAAKVRLDDIDASALDDMLNSGKGKADPKPVIQYVIIFDNEEQQEAWHKWLKSLKARHPDAETISERIMAEIAVMEGN